MRSFTALALALGLTTTTAAAEVLPGDRPGMAAMPLSEITERIENTFLNFGGFKSIQWDRKGYWEVEMWTTTGEEVDANVDPTTATVVLD